MRTFRLDWLRSGYGDVAMDGKPRYYVQLEHEEFTSMRESSVEIAGNRAARH
jgi:hypothetical protein